MTSKAATVRVIAGAAARVVVLLPKHCRWSRPYVTLLARALLHRRPAPLHAFFLLSFFCVIGASLSATLNPRLGKKQPVVGNFSSPVCHSVRPSIFNAVREQSDRSAISRVISESHYILGVSPDCTQSARTMIAKCIPPVNQSVSTHLAAAWQANAATMSSDVQYAQSQMWSCQIILLGLRPLLDDNILSII